MADRTHSHDTSTPAMSAETVPSEEFVLVPREPTHEMERAFTTAYRAKDTDIASPYPTEHPDDGGGAFGYGYRAMIAAAPTPNPSPAAKGGDAVREIAADLERSAGKPLVEGSWGGLALEPIARAIAHDQGTLPQHASALAKDGNAVRSHDVLDEAKINALPLPLIARFAGDKDWLPIHDIGVDAPLCRIDVSGKLEPRRFSEIMELKDGDGVIHNPDDFYLDTSTPTEGPAAEERFDYLSDAQARELFGTEDDDELPDGRVRVCAGEWVRIPGGYYFDASTDLLHPETASEACDGCAVTIAPTEGPASQTEGMGGDAEARRKRASELMAPLMELSEDELILLRHSLPVETLARLRAALTPPETAEAVPVASYQKNKVGSDTLFWWSLAVRDGMPNNGPLYTHPDPEAARLREDLERVTRELEEETALRVGAIDRMKDAERERDDAAKALESVTEELGLFRDFVINNATVWTLGSNHHHPIWARVAARLEGYTSPRDGEKWHLVRSTLATEASR